MIRFVLHLFFLTVVSSTTVYYQCFDWSLANQPRSDLYNQLSSDLQILKDSGVTGVWIAPPSQTADKAGYLPGEWYNIRESSMLQSVTSKMRDMGMTVMLDIVINHRTGASVDSCTKQYTVFADPVWHDDRVVKNDWLCSSSDVTVPDNCGPGNYDTGENACYAPDIDHTNANSRQDIIDWLKWLQQNYNAQAWRFDMAVGYGGEFVGDYVSATNPQFSFGEYWKNSVPEISSWLQATGFKSHAFDFPLRYTLQGCIQSNNFAGMMVSGAHPPGVMGVYPQYSATFTDDHDTARNDRFGNTQQIIMGYAYLLTHPGTPFIFYSDWQDGTIQAAIKPMLQIRDDHSLGSTEQIYMAAHEGGLYAAYLGSGATCLGCGTVAMKLGTNSWQPPTNGQWNLATSGDNYAIWYKS